MIIIVGASKGIGQAITKVFSDKKLLLISRSKIETSSQYHKHLIGDINHLNYKKLDEFLENDIIEAVFFVVGLINKSDDLKLNNDQKDEIINTNFISIVKLNEYLIRSEKIAQKSLICFFSSVTTLLPRKKQILYCASKTALNSYYLSLRSFFYKNKSNIRIANLMLGYFDTEMSEGVKTPFPKRNPDEVANFLKKNLDKLNGTYYIPFYWFFINILLSVIPNNIKIKLINIFKI